MVNGVLSFISEITIFDIYTYTASDRGRHANSLLLDPVAVDQHVPK
jgi:hypothetical protein